MGVIALGTASMFQSLSKGQSFQELRTQGDIFVEEVRAHLSDPAACRATFENPDFSTSLAALATSAVPKIRNADLTDKYLLATPYGGGTFQITELRFVYVPGDTIPLSGTATKGQGDLEIHMRSTKEVAGNEDLRPREITIAIEKTATGTVRDCIALAKMSDGIWQRTPAIADIFFQGRNVGIGTPNPSQALEIYRENAAALLSVVSDVPGPTGSGVSTVSYSTASVPQGFNLLRARGTQAAPLATQSGDNIGFLAGFGHTGTSFRPPAMVTAPVAIGFWAEDNFSDTSTPTFMQFITAEAGTATGTEKMRITGNGNVGIGIANPGYRLHIDSTTGGGVMINTTPASGVSAALHLTGNGGNIFRLQADTNGFSIFDATSVTQRLSISPTGNIGIGTTNPPNRRLEVASPYTNIVRLDTPSNLQNFLEFTTAGVPVGYVGMATPGGLFAGIAAGDMAIRSESTPLHLGAQQNPSITILPNRNVGMGILTPLFPLVVQNNGGGTNTISAVFKATTTSGACALYQDDGTTVATGLCSQANALTAWTGNLERFRVLQSGNIGIGTTNPTYRLHVAGSVFADTLYANMPSNATAQQVCWAGGGLLGDCASSERFKKNIVDLDVGLESILKMRPVRFQWKENGGREIGFIAEEVDLIEPTLVNRDKDGVITSLKYQEVTPIVVNAIKEIHHRAESQAAELASLKRENTELRQALCDIKPGAHICRK